MMAGRVVERLCVRDVLHLALGCRPVSWFLSGCWLRTGMRLVLVGQLVPYDGQLIPDRLTVGS